jgi:XTP/dITP diphosphohydrolase
VSEPGLQLPFPPVAAIASRNAGKIREIRDICAGWPTRWVTADQDARSWPEVEETGASYLENAMLKARAVAHALKLPALADDSGIEVDALDGRPGVHSARYAGPRATDRENLDKLIEVVRATPSDRRGARYRCVAAIRWPDGTALHAVGTCEGRLIDEPRGSGGFGYDPMFIPLGERRTMAELTQHEKDRISHRGRALRALGDLLGGPSPGG